MRTALATGLIALLVVLGLAIWATHAKAATTQDTANATAAWLQNDVLHAHVDTRTVVLTEDFAAPSIAGEFDYRDNSIRIRPGVAAGVSDEIRDRGLFGGDGAHVLVHEVLHRAETMACWGHDEEGIVDALAVDLLPAWGMRFAGAPLRSWAFYPQEVSDVRHAIVRATGGTSWGMPQRLYLRRVWAADCSGRAALLAGL